METSRRPLASGNEEAAVLQQDRRMSKSRRDHLRIDRESPGCRVERLGFCGPATGNQDTSIEQEGRAELAPLKFHPEVAFREESCAGGEKELLSGWKIDAAGNQDITVFQ